jgi:adenine-specific DNA-methyltransferase
MNLGRQKQLGSYYTPGEVATALVRWAIRSEEDRLLDPSCGDGQFLVSHPNSVGIEHDPAAANFLHQRVPGSLLHEGDFFAWAARTNERFECAAGNPPFIRYQRFAGEVRRRALQLCARHGADFTALTSSWAPFLVAAATVLKRGGRMAFVVPAEIGHAPYARPALKYLSAHFARVQFVAIRRKLFPDLSEDCWLLYCDGFGERTDHFALSILSAFKFRESPPKPDLMISITQWQEWGGRLRPFLLPSNVRDLYREFAGSPDSVSLGAVARVGIGYVTGANDFFHLRPSEAERAGIPDRYLHPSVRNGRCLAGEAINNSTVDAWRRRDEPILLLRLNRAESLPQTVKRYLDSAAGKSARETYKCRNRDPWYVVPDVSIPHAFLSYMSGVTPSLVANHANCVGTNSVHVVKLTGKIAIAELRDRWRQPLTQLSCELEGHPLGGGMLKLEPREASKIVLGPAALPTKSQAAQIAEGLEIMRRWRHYGPSTRHLPMD